MRKKRLVQVFLIASLIAAGNLYADTGLGRVYFGYAEEHFRRGNFEDAARLLDSALEFEPGGSDALLLKSRILGRNRKTRREALMAARKALEYSAWEFYTPEAGRLRLGEILTETRDYREALKVLGQFPTAENPDAARLIIRCHTDLGDRTAAERELNAALASFPGDPRLLETAFRLKDPLDPATGRLFRLMDRGNPANLPAFASYIVHAAAPERVRELAEEYFRLGGRDPMVSRLLIELLPEKQGLEVDRFVSLGGLSRMDAARTVIRALSGDNRGKFDRLAALYRGESSIDTNEDGVPEEMFALDGGRLISWAADADQDGIDEASVIFAEAGIPASAEFRRDEAVVRYKFSAYPLVEEVVIVKDGKRAEHKIRPGALSAAVFRGLPEEGIQAATFPYEFDRSAAPMLFAGIREASYRIDETGAPGEIRRFTINNGETVRLEIIRAAAGGEKTVRRVFFEAGKPVSGERDTDEDGRFEIREFYENGTLSAVGLGSYRETFFPAALKEWDIDGDGRVDAREYRAGGNRVRREYASLLDGFFDAAAADYSPLGTDQ